jgi:hypothetical protein
MTQLLVLGIDDGVCLQGVDYIFRFPPRCSQIVPMTPQQMKKEEKETQERLRSWYIKPLQKSQSDGHVTQVSNLVDTFLGGGGRQNCFEKCSAALLPNFKGGHLFSSCIVSLPVRCV